MLKKEYSLIWLGYFILTVYNALIIPNLFKTPFLTGIYKFYQKNLGTMVLLELVILIGLFGNLIVNFDKYTKEAGRINLILTALVMMCFFLKLIFFFMGGFEDLKI